MVRIRRAALAAALLMAAAGARAAAPSGPGPTPPDFTGATAAVAPVDYRVQPYDTFEVTVLQLDSVNRTVQVSPTGEIALPLAGILQVAGMTTKEIADLIAVRLSQHELQHPEVTVALKEAVNRKFTVEGSVTQPGVYPLTGSLTLMQGVATAKGSDQYADERHITVFRDIDGRHQTLTFNLDDVRRGKIQDPPIYPKDVIVVAGSKSKRFIRDVGPIIPLVYLLPRF